MGWKQYTTSPNGKKEARDRKFIPCEKLSKKKKRERDREKRGGWGGLCPVTRRIESPKAYKRKKMRLSDDEEAFSLRAVTKQSPLNGTATGV